MQNDLQDGFVYKKNLRSLRLCERSKKNTQSIFGICAPIKNAPLKRIFIGDSPGVQA
jgi:hypothetical protein